MNNPWKPATRTAPLALATILTGCISAAPDPALEETALLSDGRIESTITPEQAWSRPFTDRTGLWDGAAPLDLETALSVSLRNDPELRRQLARVAERQADLSQSSLPPNPVVGFGIGIATDGLSGAPAMVQLMQQLTWLWTRADRIDAADRRLRATILDAAATAVAHSTELRRSFADLQHAIEVVGLRESYVETTATTLELVATLVEAGELPRLETDRAVIDHRAAEAQLARDRREVRTRKLELLRHMGWPEHDTSFEVAGDLDAMHAGEIPTETEVVERAVINRLDVAAADQRVLAAEADARLQGWKRMPEVGAGLDWRRSFSDRNAVVPGLSISIPLLDDGSAAIARAVAGLEAARIEATVVREDAISQVRTARNRLLQARQQMALYEDGLVASARDVVRRSEGSFRAGIIDATELLLAQQRMIRLELDLAVERLRAALALVDLEDAVGGSFDLPLERPEVRMGVES